MYSSYVRSYNCSVKPKPTGSNVYSVTKPKPNKNLGEAQSYIQLSLNVSSPLHISQGTQTEEHTQEVIQDQVSNSQPFSQCTTNT